MFSILIQSAWILFQAIIISCLLLPVVLYICYCFVNLLKKQPAESEELFEEKDYAVIVTLSGAQNAKPLLNSLLQLHYTNYLIYVVLNENNTENLPVDNNKIVVLKPAKNTGNLLAIHRYAIENFRRSHTHVSILNSSDIVDPDYLNELNAFFNKGYQAVQSFQTTKHYSSASSFIQSVTHIYQRFFTGNILFSLGSSAMLGDSAMAFTTTLFKKCLKQANASKLSFNKTIEFEIVSRGHQIAFAQKAIVFNTNNNNVPFVKQHKQNIDAWFTNLAANFRLLIKGFEFRNLNQILFGVMLLQPPIFTTGVLSVFCMMATTHANALAIISWTGCLLLFAICFLAVAAHSKIINSFRSHPFSVTE